MAVSAREIQDRRFTVALRGYDRDEVIAFLSDVAAGVASLEEQLAIATAKAARSQEQLEALDDALERHITETHAARAAIIDEAKREAAEIIAAARGTGSGAPDSARTAAAIVADAEHRAAAIGADADQIVARAEESAADIVRRAEETSALRIAEADRVLDEARGTARRIRSDAERERAEILARVTRFRSLLADLDQGALSDARVILGDGEQVVIDLTDAAIERASTLPT